MEKIVKDLMIPVSDYAKVSCDDSLHDAIIKLRESQEKVPPNLHPFRAVLVTDENKKVIGKVGHLAFLKALEPKYKKTQDMDKLARANLTDDFVEQMMDHFSLWEDSLLDLCGKVNSIKVSEIMKPVEDSINMNKTLSEAMHTIITKQTLSLLVSDGKSIIGIIRLSDIYNEIEEMVIKNCEIR